MVTTLHEKDIFLPITPIEIECKLRRISGSSAAGIDGINKSALRRKGASVILAKYFNLLFLNQAYPTACKQNRTTLIPKVGKDPSDIKNWRPITISSMIGRIFSFLLDRRIRDVIKQTPRQKGFTTENGCFANTRLLNAAIKEAKNSGGVLTILDISKPFDTVSHEEIRYALERKEISPNVARYITKMYDGCQTVIKTKDGELAVALRRGVKQGDPLSPILFNLVIELIIDMVQEGKYYS